MLPVSLCLLDMAMTLCGQSSHYWNGEFRDVTEASPVFAYFLSIHPGAICHCRVRLDRRFCIASVDVA